MPILRWSIEKLYKRAKKPRRRFRRGFARSVVVMRAAAVMTAHVAMVVRMGMRMTRVVPGRSEG